MQRLIIRIHTVGDSGGAGLPPAGSASPQSMQLSMFGGCEVLGIKYQGVRREGKHIGHVLLFLKQISRLMHLRNIEGHPNTVGNITTS